MKISVPSMMASITSASLMRHAACEQMKLSPNEADMSRRELNETETHSRTVEQCNTMSNNDMLEAT